MSRLPNLAEPLASVCAFLEAQVGELLAQTPAGLKGVRAGIPAVFRPDLPRAVDQLMPMACLVVRPAGGYSRFGRGMMPIGDPRFDVIAYGTTIMQARNLAQAVLVVSKQLVMEQWEGTMIHSLEISGGPLPLIDPTTVWPAFLVSLLVLHSEIAA